MNRTVYPRCLHCRESSAGVRWYVILDNIICEQCTEISQYWLRLSVTGFLPLYGSLLKGQHTLQLEDQDILKKMIIANNHAYDHGILDEHDATQFVYTQLGPALMKQQVIIPHEEKLQFISLLNKTPYTDTEKNTILNNIGSE